MNGSFSESQQSDSGLVSPEDGRSKVAEPVLRAIKPKIPLDIESFWGSGLRLIARLLYSATRYWARSALV